MPTNELTTIEKSYDIIERVMVTGDLSKLQPKERVEYYIRTCESLGLNYLTRPFDYIVLNGKMVLYAKKEASDQLRCNHQISITSLEAKTMEGVYVVRVTGTTPTGRTDVATGVVAIAGLKGNELSNAFMKAECVPTDYEILTQDGFKNYLDLSIHEKVATYNCDTNLIEWVPLIDISVYKNQKVKNYSSSVTSFDFTEGHKWVKIDHNEENPSLVSFEDIRDHDRILLSAKEIDNSNKLNVTPDEAAILGWIITDGTIKKYKGEYYRASICQSKEENIDILDKLLGSYNITRGLTNNRKHGWKDQVWWYLSKDQTLNLFNKFGFTSLNDLPSIVTKLDYQCREAMINSMMQADGDKRGCFGKGKLPVIECFQILCTLNGIALGQTKVRVFSNSTQPFYLLRKLTYTSIVKQYLQESEEYISDVWCPTTPYGTWIMRSPSGQISITGNTKAKRRLTLSICGLGMTDESEISSIKNHKRVNVDHVTGEILQEEQLQIESTPDKPSIDEIADRLLDITIESELGAYYKSLPRSMQTQEVIKLFSQRKQDIQAIMQEDNKQWVEEFDAVVEVTNA